MAKDTLGTKPAPMQTEAIDLRINVTDPKIKLQAPDGELSLLTYFAMLNGALASFEATEAKQKETRREIAKRCHTKGIARICVHGGKASLEFIKGGEWYKIRGVNGQPGVYDFLPEKEKKARTPAAPVDFNEV